MRGKRISLLYSTLLQQPLGQKILEGLPPACSVYTHGEQRRGAQGLEEGQWAREALHLGSFPSVIPGTVGWVSTRALPLTEKPPDSYFPGKRESKRIERQGRDEDSSHGACHELLNIPFPKPPDAIGLAWNAPYDL